MSTLLAALSPMESLQNLRFHFQSGSGASGHPSFPAGHGIYVAKSTEVSPTLPCLPSTGSPLILRPPPCSATQRPLARRPDGDMRGLDSGGRWHQKDEAPSMKVKDITKSTLVCQQWRGRGWGLTFPGCPATQRIL